MQGVKKISENIGHDGEHFFCLRCGKSGYARMAQVRGHLAMCPGTAIRKGVVFPEPNPTHSQPRFIHPQPVAASCNPVTGALSGDSYYRSQPVEQQQLAPVAGGYYDPRWEERLATLENESSHMLMTRNQPGVFGDLFGRYKALIICSALVLFAVALMSRSQCDSGSATDDKKPVVGDVGKKALTKLVDKGITKGVDALFKGIKI